MMKQIRKCVFETNSSATNTLSIWFGGEAYYSEKLEWLDEDFDFSLDEDDVKKILDDLPEEWLLESLRRRGNNHVVNSKGTV